MINKKQKEKIEKLLKIRIKELDTLMEIKIRILQLITTKSKSTDLEIINNTLKSLDSLFDIVNSEKVGLMRFRNSK